MKIRIMRMSMPDRRMGVLMRVSFACRPGGIVLVLMMLVVHMCVSMSQRLVFVLVAVVFGHMEHEPISIRTQSRMKAGLRAIGHRCVGRATSGAPRT
jgi:hypothetical protein